jgi:MFS family permease
VAALLTIALVREDFHPGRDARARGGAAHGESHRTTRRAAVAAILVTAMMILLANMSIEPIITVYIGGLGVSAAHLARTAGLVMACSALGSMLTASRLGALADRIGSWNVIIVCLLATALAMVPQAWVTHWWQLAALRVAMGMSIAGLLPSIGKLARQSVDERSTGQMLGYLQSAQFSGQVFGPLVGGVIGVHLGLHSVFYVTAALLASCAALAQWARGR